MHEDKAYYDRSANSKAQDVNSREYLLPSTFKNVFIIIVLYTSILCGE